MLAAAGCPAALMLPIPLLVMASSWFGTHSTALTPMTEIKPTPIELQAFAATMGGALDKLGGLGLLPIDRAPVVHVLGASSVEESVDWAPICGGSGAGQPRAALVLVGPDVNSGGGNNSGCVAAAVQGLYSRVAVAAAVSDGPVLLDGRASSTLAEPDVIMMHNADLCTPHLPAPLLLLVARAERACWRPAAVLAVWMIAGRRA
eukprot:COSAG01_NODE_11599_length_1896_cov_2.312187_2_plen_204_part_00